MAAGLQQSSGLPLTMTKVVPYYFFVQLPSKYGRYLLTSHSTSTLRRFKLQLHAHTGTGTYHTHEQRAWTWTPSRRVLYSSSPSAQDDLFLLYLHFPSSYFALPLAMNSN